uniref:Uncharacterized protein n=1 Tax=Meloidogyne hapla TaxID=6305 RepID=A0A1I8B7W8_MELHA
MEITKINQNNINLINNDEDDEDEEMNSLIEIDIEINYKMEDDDLIYISELFKDDLDNDSRRFGLNICLKQKNMEEGIKMVEIKPIFYAKIELNGIGEEDKKELNINGIDTIFYEKRDFQHKLTRLICYLNPEGPKKLIKRTEVYFL